MTQNVCKITSVFKHIIRMCEVNEEWVKSMNVISKTFELNTEFFYSRNSYTRPKELQYPLRPRLVTPFRCRYLFPISDWPNRCDRPTVAAGRPLGRREFGWFRGRPAASWRRSRRSDRRRETWCRFSARPPRRRPPRASRKVRRCRRRRRPTGTARRSRGPWLLRRRSEVGDEESPRRGTDDEDNGEKKKKSRVRAAFRFRNNFPRRTRCTYRLRARRETTISPRRRPKTATVLSLF